MLDLGSSLSGGVRSNPTSAKVLGFLGSSVVKNLSEMWEAWVQSLGWEDPLEKGMATHSIILAWRIPRLYVPWYCKELNMTERLSIHFTSYIHYNVHT